MAWAMFYSVSVVVTLQNWRTQYSESPSKANDSLEFFLKINQTM